MSGDKTVVSEPLSQLKTVSTKLMTRNYVVALIILAVLSVFALGVLRLIISTETNSATAINVSGRQRMLSQRIALYSLRLVGSKSEKEQIAIRHELKKSIELMEDRHEQLSHGDDNGDLPRPSASIKRLFRQPPNDLEKKAHLFLENAKKFSNTPSGQLNADNEELGMIITAASDDLLKSLDRVVKQYEVESERTHDRLQLLVVILVALILLVLTAEAWFIFKPMVARISDQTKQLETSYLWTLNIADTLQKALLPKKKLEIDTVEFDYIYQSATKEALVGGDFFDFFQVDDGSWAIVLGDVAGHGIEAADETARVKYLIRDRAYAGLKPVDIVADVNNALFRQGADKFTALTYLRYEELSSEITVVGAGNPYPYLAGQDKFIEVSGVPLSIFPDQAYSAVEIKLGRGDILFMFTDGLVEARIGRNLFGSERLRSKVIATLDLPVSQILRLLIESAKHFSQESFTDDVLVLALRQK